EVEYRRLTGKTGPGAGRPSKLYRRAGREFAVSLPPRQYDLVGDILATAVTRAGEGNELDRALHDSARSKGVTFGAENRRDDASLADLADLADVLTEQGYEPHVGDEVVLSNCPFDDLAQQHTALVCGLNQTYIQGVADGLGCQKAQACLEPGEDRCCVTIRGGDQACT
ncbi:MAG TPA: transcriptional regulator, partial [Nocardioidaceae bacterium]|nr:transcriptional regulator [Nocardioidaceae bacterium]